MLSTLIVSPIVIESSSNSFNLWCSTRTENLGSKASKLISVRCIPNAKFVTDGRSNCSVTSNARKPWAFEQIFHAGVLYTGITPVTVRFRPLCSRVSSVNISCLVLIWKTKSFVDVTHCCHCPTAVQCRREWVDTYFIPRRWQDVALYVLQIRKSIVRNCNCCRCIVQNSSIRTLVNLHHGQPLHAWPMHAR